MLLYSGAETKVNTLATQGNFVPVVEALTGGGFVFAFNNFDFSIYTRRYDQDSVAVDASEVSIGLAIPPTAPPTQILSGVTGLSTGGYLLAWTTSAGGSSTLVTSMTFDADGTGVLAPFTTSAAGTAGRGFASVEALPGGGWVSAYGTIAVPQVGGGSAYFVALQSFDASGVSQSLNGITAGILINSGSGTGPNPDIAVLANGDWAVTWVEFSDTNSFDVHQRIINPDGTAQTADSIVSVVQSGSQLHSQITALSDGGYVISWTSTSTTAPDVQDGDGAGAYMQVFNADGTARTDADILVNTITIGTQDQPHVTALHNGGWVVTYFGPDSSNQGIYQKVYASDGSVLIDETHVNSNEFGDQRNLSVTTLENGDWVVGWRTVDFTNGNSEVSFRTFSLIGTAPSGFDKTVQIKEDRTQVLSASYFGFSDADDDSLAGVVITSLPTKGVLRLDGVAVTVGQTIDAADFGNLTYKPPANAFGTALTNFTFKVVDSGSNRHGSANTDATAATVTFDVTDVVDIFNGNAKANNLTGTQGNDKFLGKDGNDKLKGLGGVDTFVFRTGDDKDTIVDFTAPGTSHDILDISAWTAITSFTDLKTHHMKAVGADVVITAGTDVITLKGVHLTDLDAGDFLF